MINTDTISDILSRAKEHRHNGDYANSISLLSDAMQNGANEKLLISRGICYDLANMPEKAVADFTAAINLNDNVSKYYLYRGEVFSHGMNNNDSAIEDFEKCLAIDPDNYIACQQCSICLLQQGNYNLSLEYAIRSIAINGSDSLSYFCAGQAYKGLNNVDLAIDMLLEATRADEFAPRYWSALGRAYLDTNKQSSLSLALAAYTKSINLDPTDPFLMYVLSQIEAQLGDSTQAIRRLEQALTLSPDIYTTRMISSLLAQLTNNV